MPTSLPSTRFKSKIDDDWKPLEAREVKNGIKEAATAA